MGDDYYYGGDDAPDDDGEYEDFGDYVPKAVDPGAWMTILAISYVVVSVAVLVPLVWLGRKWRKSRVEAKQHGVSVEEGTKSMMQQASSCTDEYEMGDLSARSSSTSSSTKAATARNKGDRSVHLLSEEGAEVPGCLSNFESINGRIGRGLDAVMDPKITDNETIVAVAIGDESGVDQLLEIHVGTEPTITDRPMFHQTSFLEASVGVKKRMAFVQTMKDKRNKILRKVSSLPIRGKRYLRNDQEVKSTASDDTKSTRSGDSDSDSSDDDSSDDGSDCPYEDYDWEELPNDVKEAALVLGYTEKLWDKDGDPDCEDEDWDDLSPEQQAAATVLGYDKDKWDGVPESAPDEAMGHTKKESVLSETYSEGCVYDDYDWNELPKDVKAAAKVLGYDRRIWDFNGSATSDDKDWNKLSESEKRAAKVMGYNKAFWDQTDKELSKMEHAIRGWETFNAVVCCDRESRRIMDLALPASFETIAETLLDATVAALVSKYLGPTVFAAYAIVYAALSLTDSFAEGLEEAEEALVSQAIGMGNFFMAGQYVQLTTVAYLITSLPVYIIWIFFMEDFVLLLGLGEEIAAVAARFVPVVALAHLINGFADMVGGLMRCDGKATTFAIIGTVFHALEVAVVAIAIVKFEVDLNTVAYIEIIMEIIYGVSIWTLINFRGWLGPYRGGVFYSLALKDWKLVKGVLKMSLPLSLGSFLAHGEWEILMLFSAYMGPAEVVAWSIAGEFWEVFEYAPSGISSAAVIRIGIHLGNGNPRMAKIAAYKSLLYSSVLSATLSIMFACFSDQLVSLFTDDETLSTMLNGLVVVIASGNVLMCLGEDAWGIVSAQHRAKLATSIYFVGMWVVTIPLSAYFVFSRNYNLQALGSAVIIGYATVAVALLYLVFNCSWQKICMKIIANANRPKAKYAPPSPAGADMSV